MRNLIFAILAILSLISIACFSLLEMGDSSRQIVGGYCWEAGSSISLTEITECSSGSFVISPNVIGTDWNKDFIVAKRDIDDMSDSPTDFRWYIINVSSHRLYGPYLYDEYLQKRQELSVPSTLKLLHQ